MTSYVIEEREKRTRDAYIARASCPLIARCMNIHRGNACASPESPYPWFVLT